MTQYPDIRFRKFWGEGKYDWYEVMEDCKILDTEIIIPKGFVTDFSSVPRILWSIIPPYGLSVNASIIHDFMYIKGVYSAWFGDKLARLIADKLFYNNLRVMKISKFQAFLMYIAVRIGGKKRFHRE